MRAAQEGLRLGHLLEELSQRHEVEVLGDSSAVQGIAQRTGTEKVKHLLIRQMWVQERIEVPPRTP